MPNFAKDLRAARVSQSKFCQRKTWQEIVVCQNQPRNTIWKLLIHSNIGTTSFHKLGWNVWNSHFDHSNSKSLEFGCLTFPFLAKNSKLANGGEIMRNTLWNIMFRGLHYIEYSTLLTFSTSSVAKFRNCGIFLVAHFWVML